MRLRIPRIPLPAVGIRRLVVLGSACILLAWAILIGGWLLEKSRLSRIYQRVALDINALDAAQELELAILTDRHQDLLWEATGERVYKEKSDQYLAAAEQIASRLDRYIETQEEQDLLIQIHREMGVLHTLSQSPTLTPSQIEPRLTDLLSTVRLFKVQNDRQMEQSLRTADKLGKTVTVWTVDLALGTAGLLAIGSLSLIRRMVRPILVITDAADAFGQGNLSARAPILHEDELGALARTFNNMAEDIAERENRRLEFVAMVAHDLKNPVLAIEMASRLLRESVENEQERTACLDAIGAEAKRLRRIVRDLTDDVQVASGRLAVHKDEVELGGLVRQLVQSQAQAFSSHEIVVQTHGECVVLGDAERIERVVQNLISNAVKYSPRHTHVSVYVETQGSSALLSVSDQGPGIAPEDLQVIFQPFGRGRSADAFAEGAGLGLYVVKQIVEAHDGRIEVESEPGHGATFRVWLPLAPAGHAVAPSPS